VDQIFNFLVRDFSQFALSQVSNYVNSDEQERLLHDMMKKPAIDPERVQRLWDQQVSVLNGLYQMNP
jgi:acyl-CoA dehydrogenase